MCRLSASVRPLDCSTASLALGVVKRSVRWSWLRPHSLTRIPCKRSAAAEALRRSYSITVRAEIMALIWSAILAERFFVDR